MSAGFKFAGEVYWGTNGAVEAYAEALAAQAAAWLGPDHPLAVHFREEHEGFFSGKILFLDEWLSDAASRERFLQLLDASTVKLLREGAFTQYGLDWVESVVAAMRARVAAVVSPHCEPPSVEKASCG
ncbi:MAG: hypothetical protein ACRC8S_16965 [Fimbriiglobus sp.]